MHHKGVQGTRQTGQEQVSRPVQRGEQNKKRPVYFVLPPSCTIFAKINTRAMRAHGTEKQKTERYEY